MKKLIKKIISCTLTLSCITSCTVQAALRPTYASDYETDTYSDSTTVIYAPDGRMASIPTDEVNAYINVGWYTTPVTAIYAPDGRTAVVYAYEGEAYRNVGWYTHKEYLSMCYSAYSDALRYYLDNNISQGYGSFSLVYIDADSIPELVYHKGDFHAVGAAVYTFRGGKCILLGTFGEIGDILFKEKENIFTDHYWGMGMEEITFYRITDGKAEKLDTLLYYSGNNNTPEFFEINHKEATENEYMELRRSYGMTGETFTNDGFTAPGTLNKYELTYESIDKVLEN